MFHLLLIPGSQDGGGAGTSGAAAGVAVAVAAAAASGRRSAGPGRAAGTGTAGASPLPALPLPLSLSLPLSLFLSPAVPCSLTRVNRPCRGIPLSLCWFVSIGFGVPYLAGLTGEIVALCSVDVFMFSGLSAYVSVLQCPTVRTALGPHLCLAYS